MGNHVEKETAVTTARVMSVPTDTLTTQPAPLALHSSPSPKQSASALGSLEANNKDGSNQARASAQGNAVASDMAAADEVNEGVPDITSPHELMVFVEDVLGKLETNFDAVSNQVLERLEAISKKIDTVEQNISDLMQGNASLEAGSSETSASASASTADK